MLFLLKKDPPHLENPIPDQAGFGVLTSPATGRLLMALVASRRWVSYSVRPRTPPPAAPAPAVVLPSFFSHPGALRSAGQNRTEEEEEEEEEEALLPPPPLLTLDPAWMVVAPLLPKPLLESCCCCCWWWWCCCCCLSASLFKVIEAENNHV